MINMTKTTPLCPLWPLCVLFGAASPYQEHPPHLRRSDRQIAIHHIHKSLTNIHKSPFIFLQIAIHHIRKSLTNIHKSPFIFLQIAIHHIHKSPFIFLQIAIHHIYLSCPRNSRQPPLPRLPKPTLDLQGSNQFQAPSPVHQTTRFRCPDGPTTTARSLCSLCSLCLLSPSTKVTAKVTAKATAGVPDSRTRRP
jgi:hypothetical protein